jgi:hypothetical protein
MVDRGKSDTGRRSFRSRTASGSFPRILPVTKDISNGGWVSNFQSCELDVTAYHFDTGKVKVTLQARYPS